MRGAKQAALGLVLVAGCGSSAAAPASKDRMLGASDAGAPVRDVGMLGMASAARHVLLRAGGPAQQEPSLAVSANVLGIAMRASNHPEANDWHLRFGVAPIESDRTAGAFAFNDLTEPAYAAHVEAAGASGFHVFWLSGQTGITTPSPVLRYGAFDAQGRPLGPPVTVAAANDFSAAATPAGDSVGIAVRIARPSSADQILVGVFAAATLERSSASSTPLPPLVAIDACSSTSASQAGASAPVVTWSGPALDVYYECSSSAPTGGAASLRHARVNGSGALVATPTTIGPAADDVAAPVAAAAKLYWSTNEGWSSAAIDPSTGSVSATGAAPFATTARGVATAREGTWGLETSCGAGEDTPSTGGFNACPWDAQGGRMSPCVSFDVQGCSNAAIAGDGDAAFVAFEAGFDDLWLLPLGAPPALGTTLRPAIVGRSRTAMPRRLHCDADWSCVVLVDEPTLSLAVTDPPSLIVGSCCTAWSEAAWSNGESSSLAWYNVDGSVMPGVTVTRSPQRFDSAPPVLADRISTAGAGMMSGGFFSSLATDGSIAWQVRLPQPQSAYAAFAEGSGFRLFQDEFPEVGLSEYLVDATGVRPTKILSSRAGDSPAWADASITACDGEYFATGPFVGAIFRYVPTRDSAFTSWKPDPTQTLGCGGQLVGDIDMPSIGESSFGPDATAGASDSPLVTLWSDDGADVASAALASWNPAALAMAPETDGFAWLGWTASDTDGGTGAFDFVRVTTGSVARATLSFPSSVQGVVGLHLESAAPDSIAAIYCDSVSGDCWLSNWRE